MRKPKTPGGKGPATDSPPPGGRALERTRQFAQARGLPVAITPEAKESAKAVEGIAKPVSKRVRKPSTRRNTKSGARQAKAVR
ncbi:MAG: hypothetical protein ABI624_00410 [Casimicrobiaceae bacterium]